MKPSEPPAEVMNAGTADKDDPPKNTEILAPNTPKPSTDDQLKDGAIKDGKIYFAGFEWIDYEGGGTNTIQGDEIY